MTTADPVKVLSDDELKAHREHLDDDLRKITEMGRAIESYPWLMRERDLHHHIDALCQTVRVLRAERVRLLDLVRYCRHQLHDEKLITDEEFAALVEVGPESARRLESYDAMREQLAQVTQERDESRSRQMITRDDALRFIQRYLHAARWEGGQLMITFENEALIAALIGDVDNHEQPQH